MALPGKDTTAFAAFTVIHSRRRHNLRGVRDATTLRLARTETRVGRDSGALTLMYKNISRGCVNFARLCSYARRSQKAWKGRKVNAYFVHQDDRTPGVTLLNFPFGMADCSSQNYEENAEMKPIDCRVLSIKLNHENIELI